MAARRPRGSMFTLPHVPGAWSRPASLHDNVRREPRNPESTRSVRFDQLGICPHPTRPGNDDAAAPTAPKHSDCLLACASDLEHDLCSAAKRTPATQQNSQRATVAAVFRFSHYSLMHAWLLMGAALHSSFTLDSLPLLPLTLLSVFHLALALCYAFCPSFNTYSRTAAAFLTIHILLTSSKPQSFGSYFGALPATFLLPALFPTPPVTNAGTFYGAIASSHPASGGHPLPCLLRSPPPDIWVEAMPLRDKQFSDFLSPSLDLLSISSERIFQFFLLPGSADAVADISKLGMLHILNSCSRCWPRLLSSVTVHSAVERIGGESTRAEQDFPQIPSFRYALESSLQIVGSPSADCVFGQNRYQHPPEQAKFSDGLTQLCSGIIRQPEQSPLTASRWHCSHLLYCHPHQSATSRTLTHEFLCLAQTRGAQYKEPAATSISMSMQRILWIILMFRFIVRFTHRRSKRRKKSRSFKSKLIIVLLMSSSCCTSVNAQAFTTKNVGQSNPLAGGMNTITVTLAPDNNLAALDISVVTLTGLSTASATSPITLLDAGNDGEIMFSDGTTQGKAAWTSGTLTLTVHTGLTLASGTTYTFAFQVTNPSSAQSAQAISVAASGTQPFASAAMSSTGATLLGVANGADPLLVVVPAFDVKSIQQSTPMAGLPNTITVTLTANCNLADGSTVTVTGLTGSQTADALAASPLSVTSTSNLLGTTGVWTQTDGQLVLTAASGGTTAAIACEVIFVLYNSDSPQDSPSVSVEATISNSVGSIAQAAMDKTGTQLYGWDNGLDPFTVVNQAITVSSNVGLASLSTSLTITGSRTGLYGETGKVRLHFTACEATIWVSDTHAVCKVPAGAFASLKAVVTVGENALPATVENAVSYVTTSMSVMQSTNHVGAGSASMTVHGTSMGKSAYTGRAREGQTGCEATEWVSDTSVSCTIVQGMLGSRQVILSAGMGIGSLSHVFSFDSVSLSSLGPANMPTTGDRTTTISGISFAFSGNSRFSSTACEASIWVALTSLNCLVAAGDNSHMLGIVVVTSGRAVGTLSEAASYDAPISALAPSNIKSASDMILVFGVDLGMMDTTIHVRLGRSSARSSYWTSDTMVACLSSAGMSSTLSVFVTVSRVVDALSQALSYDGPSIRSVVPYQHGQIWSVTGVSFGTNLFSPNARLGFSQSISSQWQSDSSISCSATDYYPPIRAVVLTAGQSVGSLTTPHIVTAASLSALVQSNGKSSSALFIQVLGRFFGHTSYSGSIRIRHTACQLTRWISDSSINCKISPGSGSHLLSSSLVATMCAALSTLRGGFSYDMISISSVQGVHWRKDSMTKLRVFGSSLGEFDLSPRVRVAGSAAFSTNWISDSFVLCKYSPGYHIRPHLVATVSNHQCTLPLSLSYDVPTTFLSAALRNRLEPQATFWASDAMLRCKTCEVQRIVKRSIVLRLHPLFSQKRRKKRRITKILN